MATIRPADAGDADAIFDVLRARSRAAFGVSQVDRKHVEAELRSESTGSWVATADDALVGHASLAASQTVTLAARDPEVNDALLTAAERAARERGFDHIVVYAVREDEPLWAVVERSGFVHERDVLRMWRVLDDLPEPRWPDDVSLRTYEGSDGQRVHALLADEYARWDGDYVTVPHPEWLAFMTEHDDFDPELWFLVERGEELVACALHWKESNGRGWVKDLVVRESERGRGLGTALLHAGFRAYAARGAERVGLKVDSTNPTGAPRLYEKVGFVVDQRLATWVKRL